MAVDPFILKYAHHHFPVSELDRVLTKSKARLAGGALTIAYLKDLTTAIGGLYIGSLGLSVAAYVLLDVGAILLIVAMAEMMRIVYYNSFGLKSPGGQTVLAIRGCYIPVTFLLAFGAGIASSTPNLGHWMFLAGYILAAVLLVILIWMALYLRLERSMLNPSSHKVGGSILPGIDKLLITVVDC